jgi:hypothetical protein
MGKAVTLAVLLTLALPLPAAAARTVAPPGNSEADQYFETLPGSAGPRAPDSTRTPGDAVREGDLTAGTASALEGRGERGRALASAVATTAPRRGGGSGSASPNAPVGALGGGGMGAALPLLLAATAGAATAFALVRRRSTAA